VDLFLFRLTPLRGKGRINQGLLKCLTGSSD
jgi:hypothetical protein